VRFRVDGTLREVVQPNKALHAALISRLKIMAELDIAEKRLPQDGRISLRIGGRAIDVRVSTLPRRTASAPCCACSTRASRSSRSKAWA
jgi:general secretion pathway protein E